MIAKLRKLLADCHMAAGDKTVRILGDTNLYFLITRATEELNSIDVTTTPNTEIDRRLKLVVQLATIARSKLSVNQELTLEVTNPVRKGKKGQPFPEGQP